MFITDHRCEATDMVSCRMGDRVCNKGRHCTTGAQGATYESYIENGGPGLSILYRRPINSDKRV